MSRWIILVGGCAVLLCASYIAAAAESAVPARWRTVWDFRTGRVSGGVWHVSGLTSVHPGPKGLEILSSTTGKIARIVDNHHPIHAVRITMRSKLPMQVALRWHRNDTDIDAFSQLPFNIKGKGEDEVMDLDLSYYPLWDPETDRIGLVFPTGTDLTLVTMELFGWNAFDRMMEAVQSFWTFDRLMPYTINYLWGPRLTFNAIGRLHLFEQQPPRAWSGNRVLYAFFSFVVIVLVVGMALRRISRMQSVSAMLICFAMLWLAFDLRMGLEILSYVQKDAQTYSMREPGERVLRNFGNFHQMLSASAALLENESAYAFLAPEETPFLSQMRYFTYPAIPLSLEETTDNLKVWIVYDRPDIAINDQGALTMDDRVISLPGKILKRFDHASFLFRVP